MSFNNIKESITTSTKSFEIIAGDENDRNLYFENSKISNTCYDDLEKKMYESLHNKKYSDFIKFYEMKMKYEIEFVMK